MSIREFRKAGDPPTLISAFLYFDVSFMVWVILGPLGPFIGDAYHLSPSQKGLLTALPLLGGSLFRPVLGWMTERIGGRKTGLIGMALTIVPLIWGWQFAHNFYDFLGVGLLLGVSGASFAAALPLASGWYPAEYQGLAMGIAGAGNSGTLFATLFAPRLAQALGWRSVLAFALVPVALVWLLFFFLAKDAPIARPVRKWADYAAILKIPDTGWFCLLYSLTFGGFVGLTSYLSIFFHDQYHLSKVQSGDFTTVVVLFGSFLRPVGGVLSDRIGGYRMLAVLLSGACLTMFGVASLPPAALALALLALGMGMLGMGNGAVFQLVPQRFASSVGIMTGIVGAAGGLGGFFLPSILGFVKQRTGSFGIGFACLALILLGGSACLLYLRRIWQTTWPAEAAQRAGLTNSKTAEDVRAYATNA
ncbi:MAG TPA: MFS transporter [Bryobacteraceae bacterium]|nr:MFS transporter [Bryobacteraceae bacterium]